MATKVTVPQLGESVVEATVGKWLVQEGQSVDKDQPLVEILTDKADSEVPSPAAGVVKNVQKGEDDTVAVGDTLCEIDESAEAAKPEAEAKGDGKGKQKDEAAAEKAEAKGEAKPEPAAGAAPEAEQTESEQAPTSPSVRKLAREKGVDLSSMRGSGKGGRITRDDVLAAAAGEPSAPPREMPEEEAAQMEAEQREAIRPPAQPEAKKQEPERPAPVQAPGTGPKGAFRLPPYVQKEGDEVIPFSRRRRIIADHMVYSKQVAPDVVTFAECDMHRTVKLRDKHKAEAKKQGIGLSYTAFVCMATCRALREHPDLNARVLDDAYVRLRDINLGVAVDTEEGLVVPVIPHADELTVRGLARAIDDLAARARDGKLTPDDLANKTFTISNPGLRGNLVGGAIISQPNVGILRMGTMKKRVVVVERDDEDFMAIHPVMQMALTYDHRVVDGVNANGFLYRVAEILEQADFEL